MRDTFYLIERRRETAHVLDQANENNSVSSSGDTARIRAAYEPLYAGSLYDFPRSMIDRDGQFLDSDEIRDEDAQQQFESEEEGGNSYYYNPEQDYRFSRRANFSSSGLNRAGSELLSNPFEYRGRGLSRFFNEAYYQDSNIESDRDE